MNKEELSIDDALFHLRKIQPHWDILCDEIKAMREAELGYMRQQLKPESVDYKDKLASYAMRMSVFDEVYGLLTTEISPVETEE